ncbi:MAG: hypothetical protein JO097_00410 [Acidobacteriaceae bacterium]|nr:hypothetical protein [Acidobacteriaceae bacterium]
MFQKCSIGHHSKALLLAIGLMCGSARVSHAQTEAVPRTNQGTSSNSQQASMSGMGMAGMQMMDMNSAGMFLMNNMSGTAVNPAAWPMPMLMKPLGSWNTAFMAQAFLNDTQQSGPHGADKLYSTNWLMTDAEHGLGNNGAFQFQLMLSLEPATITDRRYPLLFQTGETAFGKPIVDGQHPHNFIMSLGLQYALALSENVTLELYFAPVGDPALGPTAYPHRASAMELPQATLSHHLQDSTHISDEVITAGIAYKKVKLEASGFYGSEPGENRWIVQTGPMNSWSARLWYFPTKNWAAQVSMGHLTHPEALETGDQFRSTASLEYVRPVSGGSWLSSLIWGRVHSTYTKRNMNSYTAESVLPIHRKTFITGRIELVDKDELFAGEPDIEQYLDTFYGSTFRIGAYTIGYTRDVDIFRNVETGIGANVEAYSLPQAIKPYYGEHPIGGNVFVRFRLRPRL